MKFDDHARVQEVKALKRELARLQVDAGVVGAKLSEHEAESRRRVEGGGEVGEVLANQMEMNRCELQRCERRAFEVREQLRKILVLAALFVAVVQGLCGGIVRADEGAAQQAEFLAAPDQVGDGCVLVNGEPFSRDALGAEHPDWRQQAACSDGAEVPRLDLDDFIATRAGVLGHDQKLLAQLGEVNLKGPSANALHQPINLQIRFRFGLLALLRASSLVGVWPLLHEASAHRPEDIPTPTDRHEHEARRVLAISSWPQGASAAEALGNERAAEVRLGKVDGDGYRRAAIKASVDRGGLFWALAACDVGTINAEESPTFPHYGTWPSALPSEAEAVASPATIADQGVDLRQHLPHSRRDRRLFYKCTAQEAGKLGGHSPSSTLPFSKSQDASNRHQLALVRRFKPASVDGPEILSAPISRFKRGPGASKSPFFQTGNVGHFHSERAARLGRSPTISPIINDGGRS
jgi:hypothetical protein